MYTIFKMNASFIARINVKFSVLVLSFFAITSVNAQLPDFTELVEKNSATVVNISTRKFQNTKSRRIPPNLRGMPEDWLDFFYSLPDSPWENLPKKEEDEQESKPNGSLLHSLGSGFVISKDGYIVTNHHVIEGADEIFVRLSDLRELKAEVMGSDKRTDIALIKVNAEDLPKVKFGKSPEVKVGEWVIAIGSPFGFDYSVTKGIVSAKRRSLTNDLYVPFIQTDAAINPGNSGGPLFNLAGEVIGVNSQIYSRNGGFMGLSFAIPADLVTNVVEQLRKNGKVTRGFLGVQIQAVTSELAQSFNLKKPQGALVSDIVPGSPASRSDIEIGDVIIEFNGMKIDKSYDLPPMVGLTKVGSQVPIKVLRNEKELTLYVEIAVLPEEKMKDGQTAEENIKKPNIGMIQILGVEVSELPDEIKKELNNGLFVERIASNSVADFADVKRGDILLRIGRNKLTNIAQLRKIANELPKNVRVPLLLWRQGQMLYTTLVIIN